MPAAQAAEVAVYRFGQSGHPLASVTLLINGKLGKVVVATWNAELEYTPGRVDFAADRLLDLFGFEVGLDDAVAAGGASGVWLAAWQNTRGEHWKDWGMLKKALAGALLVAMISDRAFAVSIGGVGLQTCSTWIADQESDPPRARQDEQWMIGYLSGVGKWGSAELDPLNGIDTRAVYVWISDYCAVNPLAQIVDAGNAFIHVHPQ